MLNRIKALFFERDGRPEQGSHHSVDEAQLAAAALLFEAARMDDQISEAERARVLALVRKRFGLTEEEARTLVAAAESKTAGPAPWHGFAAVIRDHFSEDERIAIVEMLWEVAYADGALHDLEASLLRRIGGLLYVSDRDRGAARKRVLERLGVAERPPQD